MKVLCQVYNSIKIRHNLIYGISNEALRIVKTSWVQRENTFALGSCEIEQKWLDLRDIFREKCMTHQGVESGNK